MNDTQDDLSKRTEKLCSAAEQRTKVVTPQVAKVLCDLAGHCRELDAERLNCLQTIALMTDGARAELDKANARADVAEQRLAAAEELATAYEQQCNAMCETCEAHQPNHGGLVANMRVQIQTLAKRSARLAELEAEHERAVTERDELAARLTEELEVSVVVHRMYNAALAECETLRKRLAELEAELGAVRCPLCGLLGLHRCAQDDNRWRLGITSAPDAADLDAARETLDRPDVQAAVRWAEGGEEE